jgi:hypothetical protein
MGLPWYRVHTVVLNDPGLRGGCLFLAGREEKLRGSGGIYA